MTADTPAGDGSFPEPGDDERAGGGRQIVGGEAVRVGVGNPVPLQQVRVERADEWLGDARIESAVADVWRGQPSRRCHCSSVGS
jgi:hypothetical protein